MKREQKWELRYISAKDGKEKSCYPRSEEKKNEQLQVCKDRGIKVVFCRKLYPFASMKNQHNFDLINSICYVAMREMEDGERPWDKAEYERLAQMKEKAERFFALEFPVAWIPWEDWKDANELAQMAILHRQEACIANGRPDLVTYC